MGVLPRGPLGYREQQRDRAAGVASGAPDPHRGAARAGAARCRPSRPRRPHGRRRDRLRGQGRRAVRGGGHRILVPATRCRAATVSSWSTRPRPGVTLRAHATAPRRPRVHAAARPGARRAACLRPATARWPACTGWPWPAPAPGRRRAGRGARADHRARADPRSSSAARSPPSRRSPSRSPTSTSPPARCTCATCRPAGGWAAGRDAGSDVDVAAYWLAERGAGRPAYAATTCTAGTAWTSRYPLHRYSALVKDLVQRWSAAPDVPAGMLGSGPGGVPADVPGPHRRPTGPARRAARLLRRADVARPSAPRC